MNYIESLQKAIAYMESHLDEEIRIEDVAKVANTSVYHFQRLFMFLTDTSVAEYIRRRRLTLAAQELCTSSVKIVDLALRYGYETPEAFAKAFRKQHGITPSEARKVNSNITSYNRLVIQVSLKGVEPMKYRIVEKEAFEVVGVHRTFSVVNGENQAEIPKMWDEVHRNGINDRLVAINNGDIKGVLGVCGPSAPGSQSIDYWIATNYEGKEQEGLSKLTIPAATWAVFEVIGPMPNAMQDAWTRIYSEWFPSSGYEQAGEIEFEYYTDEDPSNPDLYSEIWIPIKR
ncbi:AraC family transcriptional regulator [Paenibacillus sp. Marseille-Q4541]|uniref:AraC family transcriptional regulator n=1 Tax=Paenibacillus sp. Marseille-Q4541 TaxID=2831522 RepID=UPI001BAAC213|nr:AraC family transcriptional regulator [Paenibacillus sp. Marseille-Q4541]